jgi:N-acetylglutamate synthase-like GNAT family acetyltransferase
MASLFVQSEFRHAGIGKSLLQHCSDYAAEVGFSRIYLYTSTTVDYYKRLGWYQIDDFDLHGKTEIILSKSCWFD